MEHLEAIFGTEHRQLNESVTDGSREIQLHAFRREVTDTTVVTVASKGLHPYELSCTMLEEDLGAAAAIVRIAVLRQLTELRGPWESGRVWINDQPLLGGTLIQALVVQRGEFDEIFALTEQEALVVAHHTLSSINIARGRDALAFTDPLRGNYWPEITEESLQSISVLTSKLARTAPLRRIEHTAYRRFVALTQEEPEGYLDDPENIEVRTAAELMPKLYGARTFFANPRLGEALTYTANGWEYSVT